MNAEDICLLLLNANQLLIEEIVIEDGQISLILESTTHKAICPKCLDESTSVHSTYMRYPTDLAWGVWSVVLHLRVKRFFCRNSKCPKRTFAERFPELVACYARRTKRVVEKQQRIGVNICARLAEKLLSLDQIGISDTTVNRILRALPESEPLPVRVLGVDDWAKRKGQRYGTLLVDLERGQIVDLLNDRTADTLAKWLEKHPGIEIVSRDRSQTYAEAANRGAPDAVQIADRWHLLKNVSDAVFKILQQEYAVIRKQLALASDQARTNVSEAVPTNDTEHLTPAEHLRQERMARAQQLHAQGWTQKNIARHLNIHPKTIRRYLQSSSPKARRYRTGRLLDSFKPYLLKRWNEGCHNATQLFREIQKQGFAGRLTIVLDFVRQLREASGLPPKVRRKEASPLPADPTQSSPTLRGLTCWVLRRPENRSEDHEKILGQISTGQPKLETTVSLARSFAAIVREQQAEKLDWWLEQANQSGYRIWINFAASLEQDYDAVRAALLYRWSNGPTEGHVNRLKCLKRQMYGRANDDLLRKRVLWQGRWAFT